jgi:hypothetical protein
MCFKEIQSIQLPPQRKPTSGVTELWPASNRWGLRPRERRLFTLFSRGVWWTKKLYRWNIFFHLWFFTLGVDILIIFATFTCSNDIALNVLRQSAIEPCYCQFCWTLLCCCARFAFRHRGTTCKHDKYTRRHFSSRLSYTISSLRCQLVSMLSASLVAPFVAPLLPWCCHFTLSAQAASMSITFLASSSAPHRNNVDVSQLSGIDLPTFLLRLVHP